MLEALPVLALVAVLGALAGPYYMVAILFGAPPALAAIVAGAAVGAWFGAGVIVARRPGVSFDSVLLALAMMALGSLVGPLSGALYIIGCPRAIGVALSGAGLAMGAVLVARNRAAADEAQDEAQDEAGS